MWDTQGRFGICVAGSVAHMAGSLDSASGPEQRAETDHAYQPDFDSAHQSWPEPKTRTRSERPREGHWLKRNRAVATRHDKFAVRYEAVVQAASIGKWLRPHAS